MKVTHKLSPALAEHVKQTMRQLEEKRQAYLMALGAAKEIEQESAMIRAALSQQLAFEEAAAKLPRPIAPYMLSADGAALVGETADAPPADPAMLITDPPAEAAPAGAVNGVSRD
jgi:hypothetical protein